MTKENEPNLTAKELNTLSWEIKRGVSYGDSQVPDSPQKRQAWEGLSRDIERAKAEGTVLWPVNDW